MPDYQKGCIYLIKHQLDYNNENVYIGSCCNFTNRKTQHKHSCNNPNDKRYNFKLYQEIRSKDGWDCWIMIKLKDYKCNSKYELNLEERKIIDEYKAKLNCYIPTRTSKQYKEEYKDKLLESKKKYYEENKEKIAEKNKEWREKNRDKLLESKKKYREENADKIAEINKEYREKIKCDKCGCEITKRNFSRHKRTQKCLNYNINNN